MTFVPPNTFHNVQFPPEISYGSSGGPTFNTTVLTLANGFDKRNENWSLVRHEYQIKDAIKTARERDYLLNFFVARQGRAFSFRFKDWGDFQVCNQVLMTGDGYTLTALITKTYADLAGETYVRQILKPIASTISITSSSNRIYVNSAGQPTFLEWYAEKYSGSPPADPRLLKQYEALFILEQLSSVSFTVDDTTGIVTFARAPQKGEVLTVAYGEFDVEVRFDTDHMDLSHDGYEVVSWDSIPMIEIKRLTVLPASSSTGSSTSTSTIPPLTGQTGPVTDPQTLVALSGTGAGGGGGVGTVNLTTPYDGFNFPIQIPGTAPPQYMTEGFTCAGLDRSPFPETVYAAALASQAVFDSQPYTYQVMLTLLEVRTHYKSFGYAQNINLVDLIAACVTLEDKFIDQYGATDTRLMTLSVQSPTDGKFYTLFYFCPSESQVLAFQAEANPVFASSLPVLLFAFAGDGIGDRRFTDQVVQFVISNPGLVVFG